MLWLAPLDHPVTLLGAAVAVGAVLLAGAYGLGTRQPVPGGRLAAALLRTVGRGRGGAVPRPRAAAGGVVRPRGWLAAWAAVVAAAGLVVAYVGLLAAAGGGGAGAAQAVVELFDMVVRLGSNLCRSPGWPRSG